MTKENEIPKWFGKFHQRGRILHEMYERDAA